MDDEIELIYQDGLKKISELEPVSKSEIRRVMTQIIARANKAKADKKKQTGRKYDCLVCLGIGAREGRTCKPCKGKGYHGEDRGQV